MVFMLWCTLLTCLCRHSRDSGGVYTFSSPPTVIPSPRIRVSPPRSADPAKKSASNSPLHTVDKNLSVTDDSGTEPEPQHNQTSATSVSPARLSSCVSDDKLPNATVSRLSPLQHQTVRRSSLREIPEDEIRRSGVSNIWTVQSCTLFTSWPSNRRCGWQTIPWELFGRLIVCQ